MSGRQYIERTWVKHDDNDPRVMIDPDADSWGYNGEQIGDRSRSSTRAVPVGFLPDGKADIASAADRNEALKDNPLLMIDPAYKVISNYADKSAALRDSFDKKLINKEQYDLAQGVLDGQYIKANNKLYKLAQVAKEADDTEYSEEAEIVLLSPWEAMQSETLALDEQARAIWCYENGIYKI